MQKSKPSRWIRWVTEGSSDNWDGLSCKKDCAKFLPLTMEGLTSVKFIDNKAVPKTRLAETYRELNPLAWEIIIRSDAKWSDGTPVTAEHFIQGWKHQIEICKSTPLSFFFSSIENARAFCEKKTAFTKVGLSSAHSRHLLVRLSKPVPNLPIILGHPATWTFRNVDLLKFGVGPFQLEKRFQNSLYFRQNPYHVPTALSAGVRVSLMLSESHRLQMFFENEADLVDNISESLKPQVLGNPNLTFTRTNQLIYLWINPARKPYQSITVREALRNALDPQEIIELLKVNLSPAPRFYGAPPGSETATFSETTLKQSLASLNLEFPSLKTGSVVPAHHPLFSCSLQSPLWEVAQGIQSQWIKRLRLNTDLVDLSQTGAPIQLYSLSLDPIRLLDQLETLAGSSPELLVNTQEKYEKAVTHRQSEIAKQKTFFPLFFFSKTHLLQTNLKGLTWNSFEQWDFTAAQ